MPRLIRKWLVPDLANSGTRPIQNLVQPSGARYDQLGFSAMSRGNVTRLPLNSGVRESVETPAFVLDERHLRRDLKAAAKLRDRCGFKLLYALKPLTCQFVLELMLGTVDGFAASSLFEARLARDVLGTSGSVALTTPGLRAAELPELGEICDHITFNSLAQLGRMGKFLGKPGQVGLRINPELSLVADDRYDPCRPSSKLGVPLSRLKQRWSLQTLALRERGGLALSYQLRFVELRAARSHVQTSRRQARRPPLATVLDQLGRRISL